MKNLTNQKINRWFVRCLSEQSTPNGTRLWECECECGTIRLIPSCRLNSARSKSCGCYRDEFRSQLRTEHGLTNSSEYSSWRCMKKRCYVSNDSDYENYGKRGIKVCSEWINSFETFLKDMGNKPDASYTLDRIDNNDDYKPSNCRWSSAETQANNRRNNVTITVLGETMTLSQVSRKYGIPKTTLSRRIKLGWDTDKVIIPKR